MFRQQAATQLSWLSFAVWIGLNILGYIPGSELHYQVSAPVLPFHLRDVMLQPAVFGFILGAVSGLIIATLQRIVLIKWIPGTRLWIPWNILGFGLVHAVNDSLLYLPVPLPLLLLAGGVIISVAQYLSLRRSLSRPLLWIPLAAGAWLVAFLLGETLSRSVAGNPLAEVFLGNGTKGLIMAIVTGISLRTMIPVSPILPEDQYPYSAGTLNG
jgi:hypothetical protein